MKFAADCSPGSQGGDKGASPPGVYRSFASIKTQLPAPIRSMYLYDILFGGSGKSILHYINSQFRLNFLNASKKITCKVR